MELRITNKILDMAEDPRGFDVQPPVSEAREELAALTSERDRLRELLQQIYDEGYAAELRPDIQVILVSDEN